MKQLNILEFISEATRSFDRRLETIEEADTIEATKCKTALAVGYIEALGDLTNCLIAEENNDLAAQLDWLRTDWQAKAYRKAGWRILNLGDEETGLKLVNQAEDIESWNK